MSQWIEDGHDLEGRAIGGRSFKVMCWIRNPDDGEIDFVLADGVCHVCGRTIEAIKRGEI